MKMLARIIAIFLLPFGVLPGASEGQSIPMGSLLAPQSANACFSVPAGSHWWKTQEGSGTTSADLLGGDTLVFYDSSVTWAGAVSPLSKAMNFPGSWDSSAMLASPLNYSGTQAFSVSLWLSTSSLSGTHFNFISNQRNVGLSGWTVYTDTGNSIALIITDTSGGYLDAYSSCSIANDGSVHAYSVTYDGSKSTTGVSFYKDGSLCGSNTISNTLSGAVSSASATTFGAAGDDYGYNFTGKIGDVVIVPRVLTSGEVSCLYSHPYGS